MIKMKKVKYRIDVKPVTHTEDRWEARVFRVLDYGDGIEVEDYSWFVGYDPETPVTTMAILLSKQDAIGRARAEITIRHAADQKAFKNGEI